MTDAHRSAGSTSHPGSAPGGVPHLGAPLLISWPGPIAYFRSISSTNTEARRLAGNGAPDRTLVLADAQTAGRGRQGRGWTTPPFKALALSIVLRELGQNQGLLPFAAALATCEACEGLAAVRCSIKWPNDVWCDGHKLAGILIETRPQDRWAVLGIGVNANLARDDFPAELRQTATSLALASGSTVDRQALLEELLARLTTWIEALAAGRRADVLAAFRERDALEGRRISWRAGEEERGGTAAGIDDEGNLLVRADGATEALRSGEVHLVPSA